MLEKIQHNIKHMSVKLAQNDLTLTTSSCTHTHRDLQ